MKDFLKEVGALLLKVLHLSQNKWHVVVIAILIGIVTTISLLCTSSCISMRSSTTFSVDSINAKGLNFVKKDSIHTELKKP